VPVAKHGMIAVLALPGWRLGPWARTDHTGAELDAFGVDQAWNEHLMRSCPLFISINSCMFRQLLKLAAVLSAVVVTSVLFNPSPEKHRDTIASEMARRSQIADLLQLGRITAFFSAYHSFGVGSYTTVNDTVVSVGAFGFVHVRENAALMQQR